MSDPLRWTDPESEATTLERVLIQGEAASGPSEQVVSGVWSKISGALPPVALVGAAGTAAAGAKAAQAGAVAKAAASGSGSSFAALAKPLILGIALGGGSVVASHEVKRLSADEPAVLAPVDSSRQQPSSAPARPPQGATSAPIEAATPPSEARTSKQRGNTAAAGAGAVPAAAPSEPLSRASRLAAERRRLVEARALLRSGRAADCLALLDAHAGVGLLGQERLVIRVDALMMLGRKAEAKSLADRLIAEHPESPYASYLSRVTR